MGSDSQMVVSRMVCWGGEQNGVLGGGSLGQLQGQFNTRAIPHMQSQKLVSSIDVKSTFQSTLKSM